MVLVGESDFSTRVISNWTRISKLKLLPLSSEKKCINEKFFTDWNEMIN